MYLIVFSSISASDFRSLDRATVRSLGRNLWQECEGDIELIALKINITNIISF
jgi:hypothetical protein